MGQRSATTVDQKSNKLFAKRIKLRTSCRSRCILQHWYKFVVNIFMAGLVINKSCNDKEQSDEHAPGNWGPENQKPNKKKNGSRDSDDRLRDLPEWMEDFTDHLEDTETPCPHTFLRTQIRNVQRKWDQNQGNTVFLSLSKRPKLRSMLDNPKLRSRRRRTGEAVPRALKFGDLITADQKVLN